jgi:hypothetical protein
VHVSATFGGGSRQVAFELDRAGSRFGEEERLDAQVSHELDKASNRCATIDAG